MKSIRLAALAAILSLGAGLAAAEPGVSDTTVTLGMSSPFSGPSGIYGMQMRESIAAHFDQINKAGGINGRKVDFQ